MHLIVYCHFKNKLPIKWTLSNKISGTNICIFKIFFWRGSLRFYPTINYKKNCYLYSVFGQISLALFGDTRCSLLNDKVGTWGHLHRRFLNFICKFGFIGAVQSNIHPPPGGGSCHRSHLLATSICYFLFISSSSHARLFSSLKPKHHEPQRRTLTRESATTCTLTAALKTYCWIINYMSHVPPSEVQAAGGPPPLLPDPAAPLPPASVPGRWVCSVSWRLGPPHRWVHICATASRSCATSVWLRRLLPSPRHHPRGVLLHWPHRALWEEDPQHGDWFWGKSAKCWAVLDLLDMLCLNELLLQLSSGQL